MPAETLAALKASIAHWEDNLELAKAGQEFEYYADDCPLCVLFYDLDCAGCPVLAKTGEIFCKNSPWGRVNRAVASHEHDEVRPAVQAELDFLHSLLPNNDVAKVDAANDCEFLEH